MIKFFRKIRQNLLSEGKTTKYLKYALGEIILVVIGILIALQVNNWNEERKNYAKEQTLLLALQQEFDGNLERLKNTITVNNERITNCLLLLHELSPEESSLSHSQISKLWLNALSKDAVYRPSLGVLNEAIASGNLSVIHNREITTFLSAWESELDRIGIQEMAVKNQRLLCFERTKEIGNMRMVLQTIENDLGKELQESPFEDTNKDLLRSKAFESDLVTFLGTSNHLESGFLIPLKERLEHFLTLVKKELDHD